MTFGGAEATPPPFARWKAEALLAVKDEDEGGLPAFSFRPHPSSFIFHPLSFKES
jgi:hypothetical protein